MATVQDVIRIAQNELGVKESPANSNHVKYNDWYYGKSVSGPSYPWCCVWVCWVFHQAGMPLPIKTASCSALLSWYRKNKPGSVRNSPEPGDIVIYNFGHTGIVENAGNGKITAIEGNTSLTDAGSQSNGGQVCRRTRKTGLVTAYIRPDYEKEEVTAMMDNTPSPAHREGVEWAVANGILTGDASGDLRLAENVTRQQLCTMLYRFAKSIGKA